MKDKIIEILKAYGQQILDEHYYIKPLPNTEEFATRIDSLYTPEISEGEIDKLALKYCEEQDCDGWRENTHARLDFTAGYKKALSKGAKPISEARIEEVFNQHPVMYLEAFKTAIKELNQ